MYESLNIAELIKIRSKQRGIVIKDMLSELKLGSNTMSNMRHGRMIAADSLAKIADYLDCSVDYLLGRSDIPEVNKPSEDVRIFKIAARDGEKEIELTAAQRAEIVRIVESSKNDDNSDLF